MASFKQLFIISAITRKSSARTWRPMHWSKLAEPLKPLIHSSPGFPSPRRYLNDTLCHRHIPSCHVARMTCATSPITLAHAFTLALKITLAIEPIPYLLALVCALFALRLVFTISLVPRHQWHADVLTCTRSRPTALSRQNPYPIRLHLYTPMFTFVLVLLRAPFRMRCKRWMASLHHSRRSFNLLTSRNRYCCCHLAVAEGGLDWVF